MSNNTPQTNEKPSIWKLLNKILTIIGALGTLFSCLIALIVLVTPASIAPIVISLYNPPTPSPVIIFRTLPPLLPLSTNTPYPTYTPYPVYTLVPQEALVVTQTPFPATPTHSAIILFEDNFNSGLSQSWTIKSGSPFVVNGSLSTNQDNTWLQIGDSTWIDYKVEFVADANGCWFTGNTINNVIAVRYQNLDNMVAFVWKDCVGKWYIVTDGVWNQIPGQNSRNGVGDLGRGMERFSITVVGNEYVFHHNELKLFSFFDNLFLSGGIALGVGQETLIDDFVVIDLNQ